MKKSEKWLHTIAVLFPVLHLALECLYELEGTGIYFKNIKNKIKLLVKTIEPVLDKLFEDQGAVDDDGNPIDMNKVSNGFYQTYNFLSALIIPTKKLDAIALVGFENDYKLLLAKYGVPKEDINNVRISAVQNKMAHKNGIDVSYEEYKDLMGKQLKR